MVNIRFADNLRSLMQAHSLNQTMLAREIGIAPSAVSAWLAGKKQPSIASLWLLADLFYCSIDELVGRENI